MAAMIAYHNREYATSHELHHFTSFDLEKTWECSREEAIHRVTLFSHSEHHFEISEVHGATVALMMLAGKYDLVAVTARDSKSAPRTLPLIEKLFGDLFTDVHFLGYHKSKGEFCKEQGILFLVDDGLHNAHTAGEHGIPVYLMDRPWNQGELPTNTVRVFGWDDVLLRVL